MKDLFKMNLQLFAEEDEAILPDEDIILPDDDTTDEEPSEPQADEEPAEPQAGEESAEDTTPEADTKPYKIKIKYNHEEMEIPEDEAIPLIQKGMNYDKLQERYNAIQNDPRLSRYQKIEQISKLLGYQSDEQLIDALYQNYYQLTAQQRGLTPEQIRKEHELNQERERLQREKQEAQRQRETNAMYERFIQAFPNVLPEDIKPETWEKVKNGMDLTTAYVEQRNQELETQLKLLKQKEKNKNQAPVGGVTQHGSTDTQKIDPFLEGFDSIE
jgi:hypothetical protein